MKKIILSAIALLTISLSMSLSSCTEVNAQDNDVTGYCEQGLNVLEGYYANYSSSSNNYSNFTFTTQDSDIEGYAQLLFSAVKTTSGVQHRYNIDAFVNMNDLDYLVPSESNFGLRGIAGNRTNHINITLPFAKLRDENLVTNVITTYGALQQSGTYYGQCQIDVQVQYDENCGKKVIINSVRYDVEGFSYSQNNIGTLPFID